MSAQNREAAISKTLTYEGGFCNDKHDPGSATNWGITIFDARLHWKPDATVEDMKRMPKSVAIEIYRQKYWAKMDCDNRPSGPDFVDFDLGVNSGIGRTAAFRRRLDPLKLSPVEYVKQACAMRLSFLRALKTFVYFGKGWSRRVADVEATGVRMALGAAGKPVAPTLRKSADDARTKAIGHVVKSVASGGTGTAVANHLPAVLNHMDTGTMIGLTLLGVGTVVLVAYFVWNAVHHANRATAYTAQLAGQPEAITK